MAQAGVINSGLGLVGGLGQGYPVGGLGHGIAVGAPAVSVAAAPYALGGIGHAPVAVASHGAVSYQNSNLLAVNPTAVVTKVAAPVAAVHAPVATVGLGYGRYILKLRNVLFS